MSSFTKLPAAFDQFREIWVVDTEFVPQPGGRVRPLCVCAFELRSGTTVSRWLDDSGVQTPPFATGDGTLVVAFAAQAEVAVFAELGWPQPQCIVDLFAEHVSGVSGLVPPVSLSLLAAARHNGVTADREKDKERMRSYILSGGPYDNGGRQQILAYCESDVRLTAALFGQVAPRLHVGQALIRGDYARSIAAIEAAGVPVDSEMLRRIEDRKDDLVAHLIDNTPIAGRVYAGRVFKHEKLEQLASELGIDWPRSDRGKLVTSGEVLKEVSLQHPEIEPLRQLRKTIASLRGGALPVDADGRSRSRVRPYASCTGRNQPSSRESIFGRPAWMRSLIRPIPGRALAHIDFSQQEFGVGAALSGDVGMQQAYRSGDPYLAAAIAAGKAPPGATKLSHAREREVWKVVTLGLQYGMGAETLGRSLGISRESASTLVSQHRKLFPRYWRWIEDGVARGKAVGYLKSPLGWRLRVSGRTKHGTLLNFPLQSAGGDILRVAANLLRESGIIVCALVHDAVLIEAGMFEIDDAVEHAKHCLREASRAVLGGFELRCSADVIHFPHRFRDPRGAQIWSLVETFTGDVG